MKKHPYFILGIVFSCIAGVDLLVLLILMYVLGKTANSTVLAIAVGVPGIQFLVFGGIGLGFLWRVRRNGQQREELVANGYFQTASVIRIEPVFHVTVNGRHPYRVICRLERDGTCHEYQSDLCPGDPYLSPGDPVRVYLDRRNDDVFYVDVESAARNVIRHE